MMSWLCSGPAPAASCPQSLVIWLVPLCASPFGVGLVNIACVAAVGPEASVLAWELTLGTTARISWL